MTDDPLNKRRITKTMKKSSLLESMETFVVVSVITALIWLYAEGETIETQSKKLTIRFVPPSPGLVVSLPGHETNDEGEVEMTVGVTIQASRGDWPRINEWIRQNSVEIEVRTPTGDTEDQTFTLRDALNQSSLADLNAYVNEVDQQNVTVQIIRLVEESMPVQIDTGDLQLSDEKPTVVPNRVTVQMPASTAKLVRDQGLKLVAELKKEDTENLPEDTQQVTTVRLDLPSELQGQPFVSMKQDQADVTFILRKETEQLVLPRVQVRLLMSDIITQRYGDILLDPESQRILSVTLSGPAETLARIEKDPSLVNAWILIKLSDLANDEASHTATLNIDVPEGVTVVSKDPNLTTVTYKATELQAQP